MTLTVPPRAIYEYFRCMNCETKQVCRKKPTHCLNCNSGPAWLRKIED